MLPELSNLSGPTQDFKTVSWNAWRDQVSAELCVPLASASVGILLFWDCIVSHSFFSCCSEQ